MALKGSGRCELAELVTDHFLSNKNRNVLASVVDRKGVADKLRENRRRTAPCLDNLLLSGFIHSDNALVKSFLNIRALFHTSAHESASFLIYRCGVLR